MTYTKEENGRRVFSQCQSMTPEEIEAAGWKEFVASDDVIETHAGPGMEQVLDAVRRMLSPQLDELSDGDAIAVAALFPTWASKLPNERSGKPADSVSAGERLWYGGKLWEVIQPHTVQADWKPDVSVSLETGQRGGVAGVEAAAG